MESQQKFMKLQVAEKTGILELKFRELLAEVARERAWPPCEVDELAIWPEVLRQSWVALNDLDEVIGGFTLLEGNLEKFPVMKDWPTLPLIEATASEVSISAIHKDFRGLESSTAIFAAMYGALYWHLLQRGVRYVYAILDRGIAALYKRKLGLDFVKISPNFMKWNEEVFTARLDVLGVEEAVSISRPEIWKVFLAHQPLEMQSQGA